MEPHVVNDAIPHILKNYRKIAVVGISEKPDRDSNAVARFMLKKGYQIFPVNPNYREVLGIPCFSSLTDIPEKIDLVDIFRRAEEVEPIVDQAIEIGAKAVWMQLGVINHNAAQKALDRGQRYD